MSLWNTVLGDPHALEGSGGQNGQLRQQVPLLARQHMTDPKEAKRNISEI